MSDRFKLHGFKSPNYTPVPDEFFDLVAPNLTEAELRALIYIIRRTFGFKKDSDNISLRQMVGGIRTKDGHVLDQGTGLSKPSVVRAVKGLIEKEIIAASRNSSPAKGYEPTTYRLLFRDDPLLTKATRGGKLKQQGLVNESNIQETVLQETGRQDISKLRNAPARSEDRGEQTSTHLVEPLDSKVRKAPKPQEPDEPRIQPPAQPVEASPAPNGAGGQSTGFHAVGTILTHRHPRAGPRVYGEDRLVIQRYVEDLRRELHDQATLRSSTSRAVNLFRETDLEIGTFVDAIMTARHKTKENWGVIHGPGKMGYWFSILEWVLGKRELPESPEQYAQRKAAEKHPPATSTSSERRWQQTYVRGQRLPNDLG